MAHRRRENTTDVPVVQVKAPKPAAKKTPPKKASKAKGYTRRKK